MPERRPLLRRAAYLAAVTTTIGAFAGSLAGIAHTEGQVQRERPRGYRGHLGPIVVAHPHDGPLAELPLYLGNGGVYCLALIQYILHRARAWSALA